MTISLRLLLFRNYHNWSLLDVSKKLNLSIESYKDLEEGKIKINGFLAQKLSDIYQAPVELFICDEIYYSQRAEVLYNNCTFISSQGNCSGYVNHQYNDRGIDEILFAKNEEIRCLKKEIERLQQEVNG